MGVARPTVSGGMIAVSDSAALALLDADGLPPGTEVWNATVAARFVYTISTASLVPNDVVAVAGTVGARWIKDTGGGSGTVTSIVAGTNITVDATDPANPIISSTAGAPVAGTNIAVVGTTVSTVLTGFTLTSTSSDTIGALDNFNKSRAGGTAIHTLDYVGATAYKGHDGTGFVQGVQVGVRANGTIATNSIPAEWYVYQGTSATPFSTGSNTIAMRVFPDGAVGVGFPASVSTLEIRGIPGDTACFNAKNSVGDLQNHFMGWNANGAGTNVASWVKHGGFLVTTANSETADMIEEILIDGSFQQAITIAGIAGSTTASQFRINGGLVGHPGLTDMVDVTTGWYSVASAGANRDWRFAFGGVRAIDYAETGTGTAATRTLRVIGTATGDAQVMVNAGGTAGNVTGIVGDATSGGAYATAQSSSFAIGAPNALANNATAGFIALPTCTSTPTGVPANMVAGKAAMVIDTGTGTGKLWCRIGSSWVGVLLT